MRPNTGSCTLTSALLLVVLVTGWTAANASKPSAGVLESLKEKAGQVLGGSKAAPTTAEKASAAAADSWSSTKDTAASAGNAAQRAWDATGDAAAGAARTASEQLQDLKVHIAALSASASPQPGVWDRIKASVGASPPSTIQRVRAGAEEHAQAAKDAASAGLDEASRRAETVRSAAGDKAGRASEAASETAQATKEAAERRFEDMRTALTSYGNWLRSVRDESTQSLSQLAKDAGEQGQDSLSAAGEWTADKQRDSRAAMERRVRAARASGDELLDSAAANSRALWESLGEQWAAGDAAARKRLAADWRTASDARDGFGSWLSGAGAHARSQLASVEASAEERWAGLKARAASTAGAARERVEL